VGVGKAVRVAVGAGVAVGDSISGRVAVGAVVDVGAQALIRIIAAISVVKVRDFMRSFLYIQKVTPLLYHKATVRTHLRGALRSFVRWGDAGDKLSFTLHPPGNTSIMGAMSNSLPSSPSRKRRWTIILFLIAGAAFLLWLWFTPAGLLGKADAVGYAVCHRIDARSFHLDGRTSPLCARCSGMYLGALLGLVFQALQGRRMGMPSKKLTMLAIFFVLAFAVDGGNSYLHFFPNIAGLYTPNNEMRLITGTGMGLALSWFVLPAFNQTVWQDWDERSSLADGRSLVTLLVLAVALDLLVWSENPVVLYPLALLSAFGVMALLTMAYTMVWVMLTRRENSFTRLCGLLPALTAGFLTALAQISLFDVLRFMLTHTWMGFNL
jgi:uncharacterized membrane protein